MARILIADDAAEIRQTLEISLSLHYTVCVAGNGLEVVLKAQENKPDLILMDVRMPKMNGIEACHAIKGNPNLAHIPIIYVTAKDDIDDKLKGFAAGADDYISKPFDLEELYARIQAVLRRSGNSQNAVSETCDLHLDRIQRKVHTPIGVVQLTIIEEKLMHYLILNAGRTLSTAQILMDVWGYTQNGAGDSGAVVRAQIRALRKKIEANPSAPRYIQSIGRQGYTIRKNYVR